MNEIRDDLDGTQPLEHLPEYYMENAKLPDETTALVRTDPPLSDSSDEEEAKLEEGELREEKHQKNKNKHASDSGDDSEQHSKRSKRQPEKPAQIRITKPVDPDRELEEWSVKAKAERCWYPEMDGKTGLSVRANTKNSTHPPVIILLSDKCPAQNPFPPAQAQGSDRSRKVRTPFMVLKNAYTYPFGNATKEEPAKKEGEQKQENKTVMLDYLMTDAEYVPHLADAEGRNPSADKFFTYLQTEFADEFLYRFVVAPSNKDHPIVVKVVRALKPNASPKEILELPRADVVKRMREEYVRSETTPVGTFKDVSERYIPVSTYLTTPFKKSELDALSFPVTDEWAAGKPPKLVKAMTDEPGRFVIAQINDIPHYRFKTKAERAADAPGADIVKRLTQAEVAEMVANNAVGSAVISSAAKIKDGTIRIGFNLHSMMLCARDSLLPHVIDPSEWQLYREDEYEVQES